MKIFLLGSDKKDWFFMVKFGGSFYSVLYFTNF